MESAKRRKVVRSYRVVFRRRWRIYRLQNWRIPLPNGIELRAVGYWLAALGAIAILGRLPGVGLLIGLLPPSLRLAALPLIAAAALSRWELDGRSPHRALVGILGYYARARHLAGLRPCPSEGAELAPLETLAMAPELSGAGYPRGRVVGPARLLLRYPAKVKVEGSRARDRASRPEDRLASARRLRLASVPHAAPLRVGKVLEVPRGSEVIFE